MDVWMNFLKPVLILVILCLVLVTLRSVFSRLRSVLVINRYGKGSIIINRYRWIIMCHDKHTYRIEKMTFQNKIIFCYFVKIILLLPTVYHVCYSILNLYKMLYLFVKLHENVFSYLK